MNTSIGRMVEKLDGTSVDTQPSPAPQAGTSPTATPASTGIDVSSLAPADKSWGDRFKKDVFSKGTYVGFNYFFNTGFSVALAYLLKVKFGGQIKDAAISIGTNIAKLFKKGNPETFANSFYSGAQSMMLIAGGTLLVPVIKGLEDRRHKLEFKIGKLLDKLQHKLGHDNVATLQNIEDENKVDAALQGKKVDFSQEEKERLKFKHHIDFDDSGKLKFKEHTLSWGKILSARGAAVGAAYITNSVLGGPIGLTDEKFDKAAKASFKGVSLSGILKRITPDKMVTIRRGKPGTESYREVTESAPTIVGGLLLNDAILTVSSSVAHSFTQHKLHKEIDSVEVPDDKHKESPSSAEIEKRKKLLAEGKKDHRTRVEAAVGEPNHAL
jgi:hypothetical protein